VTAAQVLRDARVLLERGWTRGEAALDVNGAVVVPWSATAVRWSARGAVEAAWRGAGPAQPEERERALLALAAVVGDLDAWNDAPERRHEDVLEAFEQAGKLLDG
jgi:hypothetical protein